MFFILLSEYIAGQLIRYLDSQVSRDRVRYWSPLSENMVW